MTPGLLCTLALIAGTDPAPTSAPDDVKAAYQQARDQAGKTPADHVRLALWCEAHGLSAQRLHHLTLAVLADPTNAAARGLMGLVLHDGRWRRPEAVAEKEKADKAALMAEYQAKRLRAAYTADDQWALGVWCDEHDLKDRARAHLTAVTRLDPKRDAAWKRLGYRKHQGRWLTDAQVVAEKAEADAQKAADKKWKPLLDQCRSMLDQPSKRAEAEASLLDVTDPRAVPSIIRTFALASATQPKAVQLLGQVDSPAASRALAFLSVFARSTEARRAAAETLRLRDPRDFVGLLVGLIRDPIKYQVKPVGGPGSPGELYVEGKRVNLRRLYSPPPPPSFAFLPGDSIVLDPSGLPVLVRYGTPYTTTTQRRSPLTPDQYRARLNADEAKLKQLEGQYAPGSVLGYMAAGAEAEAAQRASAFAMLERSAIPGSRVEINRVETQRDEIDIPVGRMMVEAERTAASAEQQLENDVRALEAQNRDIKDLNGRVRSVLSAAIGQDLGDDRGAWDRLWVDYQGYAFRITENASPAPTVLEQVPLDYQPQSITPTVSAQQMSSVTTVQLRHSCFAAGTTVRAIDGERPIETIRQGDIVLAQDPKTGALAYRAVAVAYHNPPSPTLRVDLGADRVVATGIHRFWVAGKGWTMARELKPGDPIRTLGGVAKVESVAADKVQPVFNLEVVDGSSFLVGKLGALVHDNSTVEATTEPFDAVAAPLADAKK